MFSFEARFLMIVTKVGGGGGSFCRFKLKFFIKICLICSLFIYSKSFTFQNNKIYSKKMVFIPKRSFFFQNYCFSLFENDSFENVLKTIVLRTFWKRSFWERYENDRFEKVLKTFVLRTFWERSFSIFFLKTIIT